jgi:hypothetical protein
MWGFFQVPTAFVKKIEIFLETFERLVNLKVLTS